MELPEGLIYFFYLSQLIKDSSGLKKILASTIWSLLQRSDGHFSPSDHHFKWRHLSMTSTRCSSHQVTVTWKNLFFGKTLEIAQLPKYIEKNFKFFKWCHLKWLSLLMTSTICSSLLKWPSLLKKLLSLLQVTIRGRRLWIKIQSLWSIHSVLNIFCDLLQLVKNSKSFRIILNKVTKSVFTCPILASNVTILFSIVVILKSI